jgi:predicted N-acetyltransferase YhbS
MEIRRLTADERPEVSLPIQTYAFQASPPDDRLAERLRRNQDYYAGNLTLVAEEDGVALADASAIPMRQNIRGSVYPMAGIAGVATLPLARRRGYASALVTRLLDQMRDEGHVVSTLYPFRPSFYERFGYVGLPRTRTVTFTPESLAHLLRTQLPGEVTCERAGTGYPAYRDFTLKLLAERHGFAVLPDFRTVQLRDADDRWLVMAHADGQPVAAAAYRITGFAGVLTADDMLTAGPLGRALLLQFFARHIDQVREIEVRVPADDFPELWATDLSAVIQASTAIPDSAAPMARVLSLTALAGLAAGPERVFVEITGDPYIAGRYALDGRSGSLEIAAGTTAEPEASLTAAGLSGLVYGVLDPEDVVVRGFGDIPRDAAARLRRLFPPCCPYLYARF